MGKMVVLIYTIDAWSVEDKLGQTFVVPLMNCIEIRKKTGYLLYLPRMSKCRIIVLSYFDKCRMSYMSYFASFSRLLSVTINIRFQNDPLHYRSFLMVEVIENAYDWTWAESFIILSIFLLFISSGKYSIIFFRGFLL